jgi:hypothetical protein
VLDGGLRCNAREPFFWGLDQFPHEGARPDAAWPLGRRAGRPDKRTDPGGTTSPPHAVTAGRCPRVTAHWV